jgi:hypothetical protein
VNLLKTEGRRNGSSAEAAEGAEVCPRFEMLSGSVWSSWARRAKGAQLRQGTRDAGGTHVHARQFSLSRGAP